MGDWLDEIIQRAREEGHFDNLPGHGKPFPPDDNAHEDPAMRLANRVLRDGGFLWPWMEERQEIEANIEAALGMLARAWERRRSAAAGSGPAGEAAWQGAVERFRGQAAALNRRISAHNLKVPSPAFERRPLDADKEIRSVAAD